jgi:predicted nuclease of predicted toxin-antitoxin system
MIFKGSVDYIISVVEQGLQGCDDKRLYGICQDEDRCLITLDLDFADITRFNPDVRNS